MLTSTGRYKKSRVTETGKIVFSSLIETGDYCTSNSIQLSVSTSTTYSLSEIVSGTLSINTENSILFTDRYVDCIYTSLDSDISLYGQTIERIVGELVVSNNDNFQFVGLVGITGNISIDAYSSISLESKVIYGSLSLDIEPTIDFFGFLSYDGILDLQIDSKTVLSGVILDTLTGVLESLVNTVVMNTRTTGVSSYSKYNFNSFLNLGSNYYGVASDGIYLLAGDRDNVTTVAQSKITTGISDFESTKLKSISDGYAYIRSSVDMTFQITTNEQKERTEYPLYYDGIDGLHRRRVKLSKGIRGTSWQAEIKNGDGSNFTIKGFDLILKELSRSI